VVDVARAVTGRPIPSVDAPPRAGDPAVLVADVTRAERVLGWRAERPDLSTIVADAWAFMQAPLANAAASSDAEPGTPDAGANVLGPAKKPG
jgi:UDP-glucose 4-epimerase